MEATLKPYLQKCGLPCIMVFCPEMWGCKNCKRRLKYDKTKI